MSDQPGTTPWKTAAVIAAMAAVWMTTAGHTMNFREMEAARGWIASEGYSLHSGYLFSVVLGLLIGFGPIPLSRPYEATVAGLAMLAAGSWINGTLLTAPLPLLAASRMLAGFGSGIVLSKAPLLHGAGSTTLFAWSGIVLPSVAPLLLASATFHYGWSNWEGAFLFEFTLAVAGLAMVAIAGPPQGAPPEPAKSGWFFWLFPLAAAIACFWYLLHWGQLEGWLESPRVRMAAIIGAVGASTGLLLAPRGLSDWGKSAPPVAIGVALFAGFTQYLNVSDMGVYGGLFVNFGVWERALLVWPISCGAAAAVAAARFFPRSGGFSLAGLLCIAAGMAWAHERTMGWPYWRVLNQVEFNWFPAPQIWELWPPRFLMGLGTSLALVGVQRWALDEPACEARRRHLLTVSQFAGGAVSIGVLCLCLTRGAQHQYSLVSDRGFFQIPLVEEYNSITRTALAGTGFSNPSRGAETLMHKAIIYEANNLMFANLYGWFATAALGMAACVVLIPARRTGWSAFRGPRS